MKNDIISTSITNVIILIALVIQGVILARVLGAEGRGELAFILTSFNLLFSIFSLGIRQVSSKVISTSKGKLNTILSIQNSLLLFLFILITSVCLLFNIFEYSVPETTRLYFLMLLALYSNYRSFISLANQEISFINSNRLVISVIPVLLIIVISNFKTITVIDVLDFMIVSYLVYSIRVYFRIRIENISYGVCRSVVDVFEYSKNGAMYALPLLLYGLNFKVDQYIISYYLGFESLGVYTAGATFAELVWQIPSVLSLVIFSHALGNHNIKKQILQKTKTVMKFLFPIVIIYSIFCYHIIGYLYGDEFVNSGLITCLLMPGVYAIVAFNMLNAEASGRGLPHLSIKPFFICLVTNLILNIILVPLYGINSAAITSSITYILATFIYIKEYHKH